MVATYQGTSTVTNYVGGGAATSVILDRTTGTMGTTSAGDILLANISLEDGAVTGISLPTGWTLKSNTTSVGGATLTVLTAWKRATSSEPTTYTFSWTEGRWTVGALIRFNGAIATGDPFGAYVATALSIQTIPSTSYTAPVTGLGIWLYNGYTDSVTTTAPTGYTTQASSSLNCFKIATRTDAAGAQTTGTGTSTSGNTCVLIAGELADSGTVIPNPPVANAGANQSVSYGSVVTLTGSGTDPDNDIVSYSWAQTSGPLVVLGGSGGSRTFTAPSYDAGATLIFQLTVTDATGLFSTDTTTITVSAAPVPSVATYQGASTVVETASGSTSIVLDRTTGTMATTRTNEILFATINVSTSSGVSAVTLPTGWTLKPIYVQGALSTIHAWKRAGVSEPSTYTFSWTGAGSAYGFLSRFNGVNTSASDPFIYSAVAGSYASSIPSLAYTAAVAGLGVWIYTAHVSSEIITPPSGYSTKFLSSAGSFAIGTRRDSVGSLSTGVGTNSQTESQILFAGLLADAGTNAPLPPVANAGLDALAEPWVESYLDASATTNLGAVTSFSWTQTSGPTVQLYGVGKRVSFYGPSLRAGTSLTFLLTVTDSNGGVTTDSVTVTVPPPTLYQGKAGVWTPMRGLVLGDEVATQISQPITSLVSGFADLSNFTQTGGGSGQITATGGQLVIQAVTGYPAVGSTKLFDLTNSSVYAQLVQVPNVGNGSVQTFLTLQDSPSNLLDAPGANRLDLGWFNNYITCVQVARDVSNGSSTVYNATNDVWLRISHNGTSLIYATSPDKVTWTTKWTTTPDISLTRLQVQFRAGTYNAEPTPGSAIWDNLNL